MNNILINKLEQLKETGNGRWIACCPAHKDKRPSLTIRELDDGRLLIHCFAGCEAHAILAAVGLTFSDLYPEKVMPHGKRERHSFYASDTLRLLNFEAMLVSIAASRLARGEALSEVDRSRLNLAASKISNALDLAGLNK